MTFKVGLDAVHMILPLYPEPPKYPTERMLSLDYNDATTMRQLISELCVPYFNRASENFRTHVKESLRWMLSGGYEREYPEAERNAFEDLFYSDQENCISPPDNPRDFYIWLWEELFNGEPWQIGDWSQYECVPRYDPYWYGVRPENNVGQEQ